jgi:PAS domain S-box-containing protein
MTGASSTHASGIAHESGDLHRLLVESVQDYASFALDPQGYILSWNAGAQHFKGYTAKEAIGQHFSIFYPREQVASQHPERELEAAARDGHFEEEGWRIRKDGTRFWANVVITALRDACGRGGADVVYDPVGGDAFAASTKVVAFEGRILVVGFAGGTAGKAAVNHALIKNYAILGVYWGLYRDRAPAVIQEATQALSELLTAGRLQPLVSEVLDFDDAPRGLADLAGGRSTGRIVVRVP